MSYPESNQVDAVVLTQALYTFVARTDLYSVASLKLSRDQLRKELPNLELEEERAVLRSAIRLLDHQISEG